MRTRSHSPFVLLLVVTTAVCDRPPHGDGRHLREWTPQDHDRVEETTRSGSGAAPGDDARALTDVTWAHQCAECHGPNGRGDGPSGPTVRTPDLTRGTWQAAVSDGDIARVIRQGRNEMPKFDLPDAVVAGLVGRIRALRGSP